TRVNTRCLSFFFFQAEDGIRDRNVTGVQTCALPISGALQPQGHPQRAFGALCGGYGGQIGFERSGHRTPDRFDFGSPGSGEYTRSEERRGGEERRTRRTESQWKEDAEAGSERTTGWK